MTIKTILLIVSLGLSFQGLKAEERAEEGKQLFANYCAACHGVSGGMDMSKRLAPPIIAVRMHYREFYADEHSFVKAFADWVAKPEESKTLMRGAIRRFQLMPAMPIPREDIEKIARFVFNGNIEKPEGFDQHLEEQYGKGKGKRKN